MIENENIVHNKIITIYIFQIVMITFNKPFFDDKCLTYIKDTAINGHQSGDGIYSRKCYDFFNKHFGFKHTLLTPSCTHSMEMMALLLNVTHTDEIIVPSYTFVSTANAFAKYGAKIVCVDSKSEHPNIDPKEIEKNITPHTKAVVVVHYAGYPCDMDQIASICRKYNIILLEDAAQALNSYYKGKALGSFGQMSAFSFHETKNFNCGEGGLLVINNSHFLERAEYIREKGTNRTSFFKGEVQKYEWIDIGSSYLLSDLNAAYLLVQFEMIDQIQNNRTKAWFTYYHALNSTKHQHIFKLPPLYTHIDMNCHIFYLVFHKRHDLDQLKHNMKQNDVLCTTHYVPLHLSKFYQKHYKHKTLPYSEHFGQHILRLPLYYNINIEDQHKVLNIIKTFLSQSNI